jgi:MFS family permease
VVLAVTTLMAVLLYLDRICISVAAPAISDTFSLTKVEMGYVFGAFFFAYALGQVPAGWLGDRLGARVMLVGSVLTWSLFTALTGLATGLVLLIAARLLFGVGQAGAYPITARIYSQWMPFHRRAFASSVVSLGGRGGGALAPWVTATLLLAWADWRPVFWAYSLLGVAWAAFFWLWFRNTPAEHPACNPEEVRLIEESRPADTTDPRGQARAIPWSALLGSPSMRRQCLAQFASNVAWVFLITWLPTYLMEVHEVNLTQAGFLSSLPLLAGMGGCLVGGLATDWLTRRVGLRWGRGLLGVTSKWLAAAGLLGGALARDPFLATLALAFAAFATDTGLGATWAYFQDTGGPYVGTFLGWANMFGNLGAFVSPMLWGWVARDFGWPVALGVGAGMYVLAGLCWFAIDARVPIVPEKERGSES